MGYRDLTSLDEKGAPKDHPLGEHPALESEVQLQASARIPASSAPPADKSVQVKHVICDFTSSLAAGVSGAIVWSAATAETGGVGRSMSLGLAAGISGAVKYTVKDGLEHLLLNPEDRTTSRADFAWGAVDGMSGIAASITEREISGAMTRSLGKKFLGAEVSDSVAELGGKKVLLQSAAAQMKVNTIRGFAGGATGSFVWSAPHAVADQWDVLKSDPYAGIKSVRNEIVTNTAIGTVTGGVFASGSTALVKGRQIFGHGLASLEGNAGVSRMDIAHFNDLHSELVGPNGLPRIATRLSDLRAQSAANGITHRTLFAGDLESGNVIFSFTQGGKIENEAIARMGMDAVIPGNHPYDLAGGGSDVNRYIGVMSEIKSRHDVPLLAANLDLSAYPGFARLVKPYMTTELTDPGGTAEKVGVIGLITNESEVGNIKVVDPVSTARKYIDELHGKGVNKVIVLSHLGLAEDVNLAKQVKGISAIIGGHSHDYEPLPRWVRQSSAESKLSNSLTGRGDQYAGWEVPIVQAGSNGRWLGELNLAFKPSGAADRFRTLGRLHPITNAIKPDAGIETYINDSLSDLSRLKSVNYDSQAVAGYSLKNVRNRETALGNLVADSILQGSKRHLGTDATDFVLAHSGGIRSGLKAHEPITHYDLSNVIMNSGNPAQEKEELVMITSMTGKNVRDILEFGVHDLTDPSAAQKGNWFSNASRLFRSTDTSIPADEPGNFLQVSGLKYSFDLSKEPNLPGLNRPGRVSNVMVETAGGEYVPVDDNAEYKVATFFHPLSKWVRHGIFGEGVSVNDAYTRLGASGFTESPVDLLGEHIRGRLLDPARASAVTGRITDLTPKPFEPTVRPGLSLVSFSSLDANQAADAQK